MASGGTIAQPLLVRDVDNPAQQPFTWVFTCNINSGSDRCNSRETIAVPQGKRAVVETVSSVGDAPISAGIDGLAARLQIGGNTGAQDLGYFAANIVLGRSPSVGTMTFAGTSQTRLYVDPNSNVFVTFSSPAVFNIPTSQQTKVSGYYVDVQ